MRRDTSQWQTLDAVLDFAKGIHARVVEIVHTRGVVRVNVVLKSGRPMTLRAKR